MEPSSEPTAEPSAEPTFELTAEPSAEPNPEPTLAPVPTAEPTEAPVTPPQAPAAVDLNIGIGGLRPLEIQQIGPMIHLALVPIWTGKGRPLPLGFWGWII